MNESQIFNESQLGDLGVSESDDAHETCAGLSVKRQELTTDNCLEAASLVKRCSEDQLPIVLHFLASMGLIVPQVEENTIDTCTGLPVKRRELTPDDHLKAASLIAKCPKAKLSILLHILEIAGFSIPQVEAQKPPESEVKQMLLRAMNEYGMSQTQISEIEGIDLPRQRIYKYLRGVTPHESIAKRITSALDKEFKRREREKTKWR